MSFWLLGRRFSGPHVAGDVVSVSIPRSAVCHRLARALRFRLNTVAAIDPADTGIVRTTIEQVNINY